MAYAWKHVLRKRLSWKHAPLTVEQAMAEARKDAPFFEKSGGGVTLSGGEPMQQTAFSAAILEACKIEGFHTPLDTSGFAPWADFMKVLPFVDLVLYDFKLADAEAHRKYTGVQNETILENLSRIDKLWVPIYRKTCESKFAFLCLEIFRSLWIMRNVSDSPQIFPRLTLLPPEERVDLIL